MTFGPGKYDDICTLVRETTKADGVLVVILGGDRGNGFSAQTDLLTVVSLPDLLESVAKQIREHSIAGSA